MASTTPESSVAAPKSTPEPGDVKRYLRRRRVASALAWLAVPAAMMLVTSQMMNGTSDPAPADSTQPQASDGPDTQAPIDAAGSLPEIEGIMDAAVRYHDAIGTFVGFDVEPFGSADEVFTASSKDVIFVTASSGGICFIGSVIDGHVQDTLVDDSGDACTAAEMSRVQATLLGRDVNATTETDREATELLGRASTMLLNATTRNYVDEQPSFLGIASIPLDGVVITPDAERPDQRMHVRTAQGACWQKTVDISGVTTEPSRCG